MSLTDAEIIALAMPVLGSAFVMLVAWLNVQSIVRRRERRKKQRALARCPESSDDDLLEIKPELLLRAAGGDRPRYFVRAGALRSLLAHSDAPAQPHAAE